MRCSVPRKPRIEMAGGIYHVLNHGSGRGELFATPESAQAFVDCLEQACERMAWRLHAFSLTRNRYHLALETPRGNLVDGVHWLQSAHGNRSNRQRSGAGRTYGGRYRAILVEPGEPLANLVDFIHLRPVQENLVTLDLLARFRWSSFRAFSQEPGRRPGFLTCEKWLTGTRALADTAAGWQEYRAHLAAVLASPGRQMLAGFDRLSRGWVFGGADFKSAMRAEHRRLAFAPRGRENVKELNRQEWTRQFDDAMARLRKTSADAKKDQKAAAWKLAIVLHLRRGTSVGNRWLAERLDMGSPDAVSRYVSDSRKGLRPDAELLAAELAVRTGNA